MELGQKEFEEVSFLTDVKAKRSRFSIITSIDFASYLFQEYLH